jgi:hypothetical protein
MTGIHPISRKLSKSKIVKRITLEETEPLDLEDKDCIYHLSKEEYKSWAIYN